MKANYVDTVTPLTAETREQFLESISVGSDRVSFSEEEMHMSDEERGFYVRHEENYVNTCLNLATGTVFDNDQLSGDITADVTGPRAVVPTVNTEEFSKNLTVDILSAVVTGSLHATKYDAMLERILPTKNIPGDMAGFKIEIDSIRTEPVFDSKTGEVIVPSMRLNEIINSNSNKLMSGGATYVIPNAGPDYPDNASSLMSNYTYTSKINGRQTAPIVMGKEVDLITLGNNDKVIDPSYKSTYTIASGSVELAALYASITDGAGGFTYHKLDTSNAISRKFVEADGLVGTNRLSFSEVMTIDVKAFPILGTTTNNAALTSLAGTSNVSLKLKVSTSGEVSLQTGVLEVPSGAIRLIDVTVDGVLFTTGATFDNWNALISTATLTHFDVLAQYSNENFSVPAINIVTSKTNYTYYATEGTPYGILTKSNQAPAPDDILARDIVANQAAINGRYAAISAYADKIISGDTASFTSLIGSNFITPYHKYESIAILNSLKVFSTSKQPTDLETFFNMKIASSIQTMVYESKYEAGKIEAKVQGPTSFTVSIGADIAGGIGYDEEFISKNSNSMVKVVTSSHNSMRGRIIITPYTSNITSPLGAGITLTRPTIPFKQDSSGVRQFRLSYDNAMVSVSSTPIFLCPMMHVIDITDIANISNSI